MSDLARKDDDVDEQLVAYLDGELSGEERSELEDRLINEEPLRTRLQILQRSWDLLGTIPTPATDERSVQTTLELVVRDLTRASAGLDPTIAIEQQNSGAMAGTPRLSKWTRRFAIAGSVALIGSALVAWQWQSSQQAQQVADLPLAIDREAYASTDDLQLMRDLAQSSYWKTLVGQSATAELESLVDQHGGSATLVDAIANLDNEQRGIALRRWETFTSLTPEAQQATRSRAANVASAVDSAELLETMRAFSRWKEQLSEDTLAAIETQDGIERELAIQEGVTETMGVIGRVSAKNLSTETLDRIAYAMTQIVRKRIDQKDAAALRIMDFSRRMRREGTDDSIGIWFVAYTMVRTDPRGRSSRGPSGGPPGGGRDATRRGPTMSPLTLTELNSIEAMLPGEDAELLNTLSTDAWMRSMVLRDWAEEAVRRRRPDAETKTLQEAYLETPTDQRTILDLLPPEDARDRLMRP